MNNPLAESICQYCYKFQIVNVYIVKAATTMRQARKATTEINT